MATIVVCGGSIIGLSAAMMLAKRRPRGRRARTRPRVSPVATRATRGSSGSGQGVAQFHQPHNLFPRVRRDPRRGAPGVYDRAGRRRLRLVGDRSSSCRHRSPTTSRARATSGSRSSPAGDRWRRRWSPTRPQQRCGRDGAARRRGWPGCSTGRRVIGRRSARHRRTHDRRRRSSAPISWSTRWGGAARSSDWLGRARGAGARRSRPRTTGSSTTPATSAGRSPGDDRRRRSPDGYVLAAHAPRRQRNVVGDGLGAAADALLRRVAGPRAFPAVRTRRARCTRTGWRAADHRGARDGRRSSTSTAGSSSTASPSSPGSPPSATHGPARIRRPAAGISVGMLHAQCLRDAVRAGVDDPFAFVARGSTSSARNGRAVRAQPDRRRPSAHRRDGRAAGRWGPAATGSDRRCAFLTAAMYDADVFRGMLEMRLCLALPQDILARPGFREKVDAYRDRPDAMQMPGPTRADLVDLLS